jgi:tetratricopeptide (TPR) repeat protein
MQIYRDYSQPFFAVRRRRRGVGCGAVLMALLVVGGLGALAYTQREAIERAALGWLGQAPTPTPSVLDWLADARAKQSSGDLSAAAASYETALAMRPESVDLLNEYGLLLIDLERYDEVVMLGDRAIAADSFDPRGYALKARGLVWRQDGTAAIPIALSGLNVDRQHAPLYAMLARAYALTGNLSAAIENAEIGVDLDPQSVDARRAYAYALTFSAAYARATEQLEIAVALDPSNVSAAMELAFQYLALNRDQEAIDLYTSVLRAQPRNARAMLRLCRAYRKVGQFNEAIAQCEDAARIDPMYAAAQFQLGMLRYSEPYRDFRGAQASFDQCMVADPSNVECLYRLGLTHYYLYLQRAEGAEACQTAWDMLNQARRMAETRTALAETLTTIDLGIEHVARDCPGNLAAQVPLNLTPVLSQTLTPAAPDPQATPGA